MIRGLVFALAIALGAAATAPVADPRAPARPVAEPAPSRPDRGAAARQVGKAAMQALAMETTPIPAVERVGWLRAAGRRFGFAGLW